MNRRLFLALTTGSILSTAISTAATAEDQAHVQYSRDVYEQALASGEPFMLDFYASW